MVSIYHYWIIYLSSKMDLHLVVSFFALVFIVDFHSWKVSSCQCSHTPHPQQYMCDADYVIRGKVIAEAFVPNGGIKSSKAPVPTLPPATTTKRPPFKFPDFRERQWWEPVLRRPHPRNPPPRQPEWRNPFLDFQNPPPLVLADEAPPPEPQHLEEPDLPLMVADQPRLAYQHGAYKETFPWQYRRRYTLKVDKVYKGEEMISVKSTVNVFTEPEESMCGKQLKMDTRYLIAGYIVDGEIFIGLCDWVVEKSKLTKDQRRGLRHTYKKYCDVCRIKSGTLYWPPEAKEKDVCPYNPYLSGNTDCEGKYSSCIRSSDGTCNWMETRQLKHCKRKIESSVFL